MCEEKLFIHCSFLPPEQDYNTLDSRAVVLSPLGYTETRHFICNYSLFHVQLVLDRDMLFMACEP